MTDLLNEMEIALTDLLQSGLATAACGQRLRKLAEDCEGQGLHTGAALLTQLEKQLNARTHTFDKHDLVPADTICRTVRYIALCREKCQEELILERWQHEGGNP